MNAQKIIPSFSLIIFLITISVRCGKIDQQMTDDEITKLFHTSRYNIPEYEVVPVLHNLHKRSNSNLQLQFNAFGKKIDTYLQPSDGILAGQNTPVWLAFTHSDGRIGYKKMRENIVGIVSGFFNSPLDLSTVVVSERKGNENPSFEGVVDGFLLRPLPARFQEMKRFKRNILSSNTSEILSDTNYHVIIKSKSIKEEQKIKALQKLISESSLSNDNNTSKVKRSSKEIIYPSLLISTDFQNSKTTQDDLAYYDEIIYQLAFWNAVDLRYRHVENPKIRLRIAGIIIGQDRKAIPYLYKNRQDGVLKVSQAAVAMQKYWDRMTYHVDFPVKAYDILVTMTDSDMIGKRDDGSPSKALGFALYSTLCAEPSSQYHALAVIKDKGGFDGIITAAHELGHIMGLTHDKNYGDECDASHGFIMSPSNINTPKNFEWSSCSLKKLSSFLRRTDVNCADEPAEFHSPGPSVPRFLPGIVIDTHKQCQGRGYSWACDPNPGMCGNMKCYHSGWQGFINGWWCQETGPAAEGTVCAPDHKCLDGVCQCLRDDCIFEKKKLIVI